ncbi:hypothetical protein EDB92DRAFT_105687 [Lactarius akahatsu]|uniref:Uncharacterized protein n=1 Tax=Lactarius akahatsu TaxID=416441 RepID=A0AAD4LKK2_9AGAM|nr:hypothetical protein EDB92DRAFT_105687 [Lactarius akahatsu]
MPKRNPTSLPPADGSKYLIVTCPYPLNADLELHADQRTLVLWLACCAGKDVLLAMFHRPSSPDMVIIEVDREFDRFHELLGVHVWSEFLTNPTEDQMNKSSTMFYSTYNTARLVKDGWKRIVIEEHWFQGWTPDNSTIRYPYPKTSHSGCNGPSSSEKSDAPMCRLLRQQRFPVPPLPPAPPVGPAECLASRNSNAGPTPPSTKRGKRAAPRNTSVPTSASPKSTMSFSPPPTQSSTPSSVASTDRAKIDAWRCGLPSNPTKSLAGISRAPSTLRSSSARSSRRAPPAPSGLGLRLTSQSRTPGRSDRNEDDERFEPEQIDNPPVSIPTPTLSSTPTRRQGCDPDSSIEPQRVYDYYNEDDQPRDSTAAAMSDLFDGYSFPEASSGASGARPLGLEDPDHSPLIPPADVAAPASGQSQAGGAVNLWEGYDAPRLEPPTKVQKKGEWTCPQHGSLCSPGICKERARVERDRRVRDEREKWEEERTQREMRRAKEELKRERKKAKATGEGVDELLPHLRGNTSSSSSSGSDSDTSHDEDSSAPPEPDREGWTVPWNTGGTDTQCARDYIARLYDDDEEEASFAMSCTTNTSSAASSPSPTSMSSSGRSEGPILSTTFCDSASPTLAPPPSPFLATRQPTWDACSAASQSSSVGGRSERPSLSGDSPASTVSTASADDSDTDQRTGMDPATRRSARSSASSSARTDASPYTPSTPSKPNRFPTLNNTYWGDPVTMVLAKMAEDDSRRRGGREANARPEGGLKVSKNARKRRNWAKNAQAQAGAQAQAALASLLEAALDVELPPGGPGSSWGNPNEVW